MALQQRTVPSRIYAPGIDAFDIPPSAQRKFTGLRGSFTRENWPDGVEYVSEDGSVIQNVVAIARFLRTEDDGQTWQQVGGCVMQGGVLVRGNGQIITSSGCGFSFFTTDADGNSVPVAAPGDTRVEFERLVTLRTAITLTMLE